jgi:hypothetical protein
MKSLLPMIGLVLTMSSFAQVLEPNQCLNPNTVIARSYQGLSSEDVAQNFERSGTESIATSAEFSGQIKARIFRAFNVSTCVPKSYNYQVQVCTDIDANQARGQGNQVLNSFFDLNISTIKRAEIFARHMSYGRYSPSTRLVTANEVVKNLTRLAVNAGTPRSWESLVAMMKKITAEGYITTAEYEDIMVLNATANRRVLGLTPMSGVQVSEGKGNGRLQRLFDLNLTPQGRVALINRTITGIPVGLTQAVSDAFINFAMKNGVPSTWGQFVLLINGIAQQGVISLSDAFNITENLEMNNRANLGFEVRYFVCELRTRLHTYNAIEVKRVQEYDREVKKAFKVSLKNAPLLKGEKETIKVNLNSLSGLSISTTQTYNSYTSISTQQADLELFTLTGTRKKVTPPNSISGRVVRSGNFVNLALQNNNYLSAIGGKVMVDVEFYENIAIFKDKLLATKSFELANGSNTSFYPNVPMNKPSRKAYIKVKMRVIGSPYYNENPSEAKEIKQ